MKSKWSLRGQNRGASLIAVVIAMIFVTIIGAIILGITTTNIQMRAAEISSKKNFYSAEELMNELAAGLNNSASVAMQQAYVDVLVDYRDIVMTGDSMQKAFQQRYMEELEKVFWDGTSPRSKSTDPLDASKTLFVLGNYQKSVVYDGWWKACAHSTYSVVGDFIASDEGQCLLTTDDEATYTLDYVEGVLTLQNVKLRYIDSQGYETLITTDIAFHTPELNPDNGQIKSFMNYALIADEQIQMIMSSTINVRGSAYAGHDGILIGNVNANIVGDNIVTRGDIQIENGANATFGDASSRVWAENIETVGDAASQLQLNGNCYVADDLSLSGKGSRVTLTGNYYGYNFREDYDAHGASNDKSEFSSAIVLNGANSRLDMSGLSYLYLAGRTYISRGGAGTTNADIPMGESLAVRTNQLAYNVPIEYLVFDDPAAPNVPTDFLAAAYASSVGLTETQVTSRLDTTDPVVRYRYVDSGAENFRYYLNFSSEQAANDFFYDYWTANSARLSAYGSNYADAILLGGDLLYSMNGDLMSRNTGGAFSETRVTIEPTDWNPSGIYYVFSDKLAVNYMALQMYLEDFHAGIDSSNVRFYNGTHEIDKTVDPLVRNLIDMDLIEAPGFTDVNTVTADGELIVVKNGDYSYISSAAGANKGIIIASGDVTVVGNFTGTIIAGGTIDFTGNSTVTADPIMLSQMFREDAALEGSSIFAKFFKSDGSSDDNELGSVQLGDYLSYENWTRTEN